MVPRRLQNKLKALSTQFSAIVLTGPRQSGKTTLCRGTFNHLPYVNLEAPDVRAFALDDPRGFLDKYATGAIFDEIQRAPELVSYLQPIIDENPIPGRFILTGSEHLTVTQSTSQSLAGRAANVYLLPLDATELDQSPIAVHHRGERSWFDVQWKGGYPALYNRDISVQDWMASYFENYVQRDVHQLLRIGDLNRFSDFVRLAASRASCLVHASGLSSDAGISQPTVAAWLSVLEASFITFRLAPWHKNLGKRLIKTPKLYFWDTGLLCYLLNVRDPEQLRLHPLRGAIAENWAIAEFFKASLHQGSRPEAYFYRDQRQLEVDFIARRDDGWWLSEIKSGQTIAFDMLDPLVAFEKLFQASKTHVSLRKMLIYGGEENNSYKGVEVLSWRHWPVL